MLPDRLFVYGTLLDPHRMADILGSVEWRWAGGGTVRGRLYDAGAYPVLRRSESEFDRVPGKVALFPDSSAALERLDEYEGVREGLFRREEVTVTPGGGEQLRAWVYVYARDTWRLRRIPCWRSKPLRIQFRLRRPAVRRSR